MTKPSETIFSSTNHMIAMPDVAFVEKQHDNHGRGHGAMVVMKHTRWDPETGCWANACYLAQDEYESFSQAYCSYRNEIDGVADLSPDSTE